MCNYSTR